MADCHPDTYISVDNLLFALLYFIKLVGGIEVRLRPHHYLCIQFFTGHGYDESFTAHMEAVISDLKDDSDIIVTEGCDEICSQCPNMTGGRCDDYDRVSYLDTQVMDQTGIDYGKKLRWKDVVSAVNDRILKTAMFETICSECRWYELCRDMRERR